MLNAEVETGGQKARPIVREEWQDFLMGTLRVALPDKDMFGGTPNMARETHALPAQRIVAFWRFFAIVSWL